MFSSARNEDDGYGPYVGTSVVLQHQRYYHRECLDKYTTLVSNLTRYVLPPPVETFSFHMGLPPLRAEWTLRPVFVYSASGCAYLVQSPTYGIAVLLDSAEDVKMFFDEGNADPELIGYPRLAVSENNPWLVDFNRFIRNEYALPYLALADGRVVAKASVHAGYYQIFYSPDYGSVQRTWYGNELKDDCPKPLYNKESLTKARLHLRREFPMVSAMKKFPRILYDVGESRVIEIVLA